jgi:hypothetical protein
MQTTLISAKQFARTSEFKTQVERNSCTVWFHRGNGHNFKAKQCAKYLYLTRYHTTGSQNTDIETKRILGARFPVSWEDARELFYL